MQVLIVDDEPEVSAMLARALSQYGVRCKTVRTALGGMRELRKSTFVAALLDIHLAGGLSGIELAWRIRRRNSQIKILIFSAIHHGPEIQREIDALKATFFEKPVSAEAIFRALRGDGL